MLLGSLEMVGGSRPVAAICGVTLYNRTFHLVDKRSYKRGTQMVAFTRFAG